MLTIYLVYSKHEDRYMKLQQSGNAYFLYVPKALVEDRGWLKGDEFHTSPTPTGIEFIHKENRE